MEWRQRFPKAGWRVGPGPPEVKGKSVSGQGARCFWAHALVRGGRCLVAQAGREWLGNAAPRCTPTPQRAKRPRPTACSHAPPDRMMRSCSSPHSATRWLALSWGWIVWDVWTVRVLTI